MTFNVDRPFQNVTRDDGSNVLRRIKSARAPVIDSYKESQWHRQNYGARPAA